MKNLLLSLALIFVCSLAHAMHKNDGPYNKKLRSDHAIEAFKKKTKHLLAKENSIEIKEIHTNLLDSLKDEELIHLLLARTSDEALTKALKAKLRQ